MSKQITMLQDNFMETVVGGLEAKTLCHGAIIGGIVVCVLSGAAHMSCKIAGLLANRKEWDALNAGDVATAKKLHLTASRLRFAEEASLCGVGLGVAGMFGGAVGRLALAVQKDERDPSSSYVGASG